MIMWKKLKFLALLVSVANEIRHMINVRKRNLTLHNRKYQNLFAGCSPKIENFLKKKNCTCPQQNVSINFYTIFCNDLVCHGGPENLKKSRMPKKTRQMKRIDLTEKIFLVIFHSMFPFAE